MENTYYEIELKTLADAAFVYAHAKVERCASYDSPTLHSDLAYTYARAAAHLIHTLQALTPPKPTFNNFSRHASRY